METFTWSKSSALKKDALECSQETQLKAVLRNFIKKGIDIPHVN